jgi:membrane associated rhomboid family serine protease
MPLWIGMIFMLGILWWASIGIGLPIGNTAHLGGLIIGLIYGFYLRKRYIKKITLLNRILR